MHWLKQLIDVPFVTILRADDTSADLDVSGLTGVARRFEPGICIGLKLNATLDEARLNAALLRIASSRAPNDGLSREDDGLYFWRLYPALASRAERQRLSVDENTLCVRVWGERLELQLAAVRQLCRPAGKPLIPSAAVPATLNPGRFA